MLSTVDGEESIKIQIIPHLLQRVWWMKELWTREETQRSTIWVVLVEEDIVEESVLLRIVVPILLSLRASTNSFSLRYLLVSYISCTIVLGLRSLTPYISYDIQDTCVARGELDEDEDEEQSHMESVSRKSLRMELVYIYPNLYPSSLIYLNILIYLFAQSIDYFYLYRKAVYPNPNIVCWMIKPAKIFSV